VSGGYYTLPTWHRTGNALQKLQKKITRSQAVAKIADRTASQHFWGSRDVISHVTIWYSIYVISYWWSFGTKPLSRQMSINVKCNALVDV